MCIDACSWNGAAVAGSRKIRIHWYRDDQHVDGTAASFFRPAGRAFDVHANGGEALLEVSTVPDHESVVGPFGTPGEGDVELTDLVEGEGPCVDHLGEELESLHVVIQEQGSVALAAGTAHLQDRVVDLARRWYL